MRNLFLIALLSFGLYSCSTEEVDPVTSLDGQVVNRIDTDCATILDLKAGQNFVAGTVTVTNDATNIYVEYQTTGGWQLNEVHLHVGTFANMPKNNGGPIPGLFQYKASNLFQNYYKFTVPRSSVQFDSKGCFVIAAHAAVSKSNGTSTQTETAWSEGIKVAKAGWATYSEVCLKDCTPDCDYEEETAFGGSTAGGGNAWWYYYTNDGTQQPIYAGKKLIEGAYVQYINGELVIELGDNMELASVSEAVKIQGYDVLPLTRPASGLFTTYKGADLIIEMESFNYYVIHLDVKIENCNITPIE